MIEKIRIGVSLNMQENTNSRLPEDMSTEAFDYYFKVYLDKVIGLVHTLQIKSHKQAED